MPNKLYPKILFLFILLATSLFAWHYPSFKLTESNEAVNRVIESIGEISQSPHSFRNPAERERIANYLSNSLKYYDLKPEVYIYDSIKTRIGTYVTAKNIFVRIEPEQMSDTTSYLTLIAHYDSTGKPSPRDSTLYSYGAADNGYGVGIILELLNQAISYRSEWKQGLCILFTDLEEEYTAGMKKAVSDNYEIFESVGLAINIDARGTKGPALLFETSPGNKPLLDLYENAQFPYSYSLTTLVYQFMPNYTDFGCIRDSIPGMSFAVIDNLDKYHTELDNLHAISPESIGHYLLQISPMVKKFLTAEKYRQRAMFQADENQLYFTAPYWGIIRVTDYTWGIINWSTFILFLFVLFLSIKKHKVRIGSLLLKTAGMLILGLGLLAGGTLVAWLIAKIQGEPFHITHTTYIKYDIQIAIVFILLITIVGYNHWRGKNPSILKEEWNLALITFLSIEAFISYLIIKDNFFFLIPSLTGVLFLIIRFLNKKWILFIMPIPVLLIEIAFLKQLYYALTIGALGIISLIAVPACLLICLMYDKATTASRTLSE
ncbi:MAG: M28 family peptidase [Bacteroidales bacterium]